MLLQKKRLSLVASTSDNESIDGRSITPPSSLDRSTKTKPTEERVVVIKVHISVINLNEYIF